MRCNFKDIISLFDKDSIINYYITQNHNFQDTVRYFGICNGAMFQKILKYFGIKKDKSLGYENRTKAYYEKPEEERKAIIEKTKEIWKKTKRSQSVSSKMRVYWTNVDEETVKQRTLKTNNTKEKNHSFNTSKGEEAYYKYLISLYGEEDVIRQYRDEERYPFNCDFYIPSQDLFIELNLSWVHGGHPFNPRSKKDRDQLKIWEEKSKTSLFYFNAIEEWTISDVEKIKIAKKNNLNYEMIYELPSLPN